MLKIINGDLLEATEQYICHQCNCVTHTAAGLAKYIFEKYPYADIYKNRTTTDIPGDIIIKGNGFDQRYIINILGQYYPGKPSLNMIDGYKAREANFFSALKKISLIDNLTSLAFPINIGCGMAGGNWERYLNMIQKLSDYKKQINITIYNNEGI